MALKIAVVGTGKVATQNYIPVLAAQNDVTIGYFNRTPDKAAAAAQQFGGTVFDSLEELAAWQPDSTLVLTAETCRHELGTALLNFGVPRLFFEKPLVAEAGQAHVSEDDFRLAKAMLDLAGARDCETAMVFNYRFFDQTIAARQIATERGFGEVINVTALVHFACWSHCIDLVHFFAGSVAEISALSSSATRSGAGITAVDVVAALRLENGGTGTLIGTTGLQFQHPLYELTFTFERGRIHLRDLDGDLEILDGATQRHETLSLVRATSRWEQYRASFRKSLEAYLTSLRDGTPPPVPGLDGLKELQVEAALRRSIAERRPVLVQQEFVL